jgi:hypothetical protein
MTTLVPMGRISLAHLLTVLAISASAASPASANATTDLTIDCGEVGGREASVLLGRNLAMAMSELRQLDAIHLGTTWALSPDPVRREAIARSLEWMFPLVGDSVIIDHLSRDIDPAIRAASARAAWIRRTTGGDPGVLARLSHDSDLEVRSIALRSQR